MKRFLQILVLISALALGLGCATRHPADRVYQTSTIDALLAGVYDGETTLQTLLGHGDFGIGTFDGLDGEMLVLDGVVYQVKADGKIYTPASCTETPFATVCRFATDSTFSLPPDSNYEDVQKYIDSNVPNRNLFDTIRIDGRFSFVKTRSVPAQEKPCPPLAEVAKHQRKFMLKEVRGTIVGFRCPDYVKGINVPGYHLHFITADRTAGGHILDFRLKEAVCKVDVMDKFFLTLPSKSKHFQSTDLSTDRSEELHKVEK